MCDLKLKKIARRILTRTKYFAKRTGGPTLETPECKKAQKPGFDTKIDFRGLAKICLFKILSKITCSNKTWLFLCFKEYCKAPKKLSYKKFVHIFCISGCLRFCSKLILNIASSRLPENSCNSFEDCTKKIPIK